MSKIVLFNGILIFFLIFLFIFFVILLYLPKNKEKFEYYSNLPFLEKNKIKRTSGDNSE